MKLLIQRVLQASVNINNKEYSAIRQGLLTFVGIEKGDTIEQVEKLSKKVCNLRIFEDENSKMNKSLLDINGEMLIVSQFTLCGNCKKGTRPSFDNSEKPELANVLYEKFIEKIKENKINVSTGVFGADMKISLINDGPVTFILEANNG